MFRKILILILSSLVIFEVTAQVRQIPQEVRESFYNQYPKAENIEFKDQLIKVYIHFTLDNEKHVALYSNKGAWRETEKIWEYERLTENIKDGFEKSKYADWKISETVIIYRPGAEEYRIKAEKNDLQKKYLFFNPKGRLKRDTVTI